MSNRDDSLSVAISAAMRLKAALELPIPTGAGLEIHIMGKTAMVRIPIYVSSRLKDADPEWTICEVSELAETIAKLYLAVTAEQGTE